MPDEPRIVSIELHDAGLQGSPKDTGQGEMATRLSRGHDLTSNAERDLVTPRFLMPFPDIPILARILPLKLGSYVIPRRRTCAMSLVSAALLNR